MTKILNSRSMRMVTRRTTTTILMTMIPPEDEDEDGTESEMSLFTATSVVDDPGAQLYFGDKIPTGK